MPPRKKSWPTATMSNSIVISLCCMCVHVCGWLGTCMCLIVSLPTYLPRNVSAAEAVWEATNTTLALSLTVCIPFFFLNQHTLFIPFFTRFLTHGMGKKNQKTSPTVFYRAKIASEWWGEQKGEVRCVGTKRDEQCEVNNMELWQMATGK